MYEAMAARFIAGGAQLTAQDDKTWKATDSLGLKMKASKLTALHYAIASGSEFVATMLLLKKNVQ